MTDQQIWTAIAEMVERTVWPESAVVDAVAMQHDLSRADVVRVWRERLLMAGGG